MYFKATYRHNTKINKSDWYYRLVESYRNVLGEVRQRTVLSVGFLNEFSGDQIDQIEKGICDRLIGQQSLFGDTEVTAFVETLYQRMMKEKKVDLGTSQDKKDIDTVDLNTLKNKDVRELGAEWLSLQALRELGIDNFLFSRDWSDEDVSLAMSHIVSRAVYPASELKTVRFMEDNSSICELTGYDIDKLTKDKLYAISKKLLAEKQGLETYLSKKTNDLFDLQDEIILYDLTNSYFEGDKRGSHLARHGRSKEKRSDCPLVVLALVVNVEGFIKHSSIFQGNMSDSKSLCQVIDHLRSSTSTSTKRAIVVIDAGIATEENLALIQEKGYDYVCVSRSTKAEIKKAETGKPVIVNDRKNREITLEKVLTNNDSAYFMKVTSPTKALKEKGMKTLFEQRFEDGLECIKISLTKKSGVKSYEKVIERIGRLKQKYPSAHGRYKIDVEKQIVTVNSTSKSKKAKEVNTVKTKEICSALKWEKIAKLDAQKQEECGVYFLRTCIQTDEETLLWSIYNCIRNIESTFRTLKTDLDLRPIFHKSDEATQAHLHLGLLAYWVVSTVRFKLQQKEIKSEWREIVRVMNTQKCVTTLIQNTREQWISIRKCSEPEEKATKIYDALKYKYAPFIRKKSVVPKPPIQKNEAAENYNFIGG